MKDKKIEQLIKKEIKRQNETLDLIPSENIASRDVREALGSVFTNKYAEGYPRARYYRGNEAADELEELCRVRALDTFGLSASAWHVNVQPYSGSPANLAVYLALVPFGEKIMGLQLAMGGHLTHGHSVSATGKFWKAVQYGVDQKTERLDYAELAKIAREEKPKIIVAGYTAYPRIIDFKKFREIADSVGAYLLIDMSHFAGLVAGAVYPSPFPYADIVMATTHKTLRGPRGAVLFVSRKSKTAERNGIDITKAIDRAVFPGLQGGPHLNQIAGMAVMFFEAKQSAFKKYAEQVVKNAKVLANELAHLGWRVISGGTDTHLILFEVSSKDIGGEEASVRLEMNGIVTNKNTIPFDPNPPANPSGIRLGTPSLTTRGMKEREMKKVARFIHAVLAENKNVKRDVLALCKKFPVK